MNDLAKLTIDREGKSPERPLRRRRRPWRYVALTLAIAGAAWWVYQRGGLRPAPAVEVGVVATAWPAQAVTLFNATGYVVPQTRADVASKATGRLEALEVEEGSVVTKGQVLARLESQDVVATQRRAEANVTAAEAAITEARARRAEAVARLAEAKAEHLDAQRSLERAKAMVGKNYVTQEVYDTALNRRARPAAGIASAEAGVAAAEASIAVATAQLGAAKAAVEEATVAVEYTLIRAPFDGVVLSKQADIGDVVAPFASTTSSKGAVVTMADLGTLQVETDISESNLVGVTIGQPCEIQLDALPDVRLRGEVHMIVPTVDRTKATVLAKVRFVDTDKRILPDMSARVAFLSRAIDPAEQQALTVVPPAAIRTGEGRSVVFRIDGETVKEIVVTPGAKAGDAVVVDGELKTGEKIVLNPPAELRDGARVRLAQP
jgi:RND family efflux transporter MFP subunit